MVTGSGEGVPVVDESEALHPVAEAVPGVAVLLAESLVCRAPRVIRAATCSTRYRNVAISQVARSGSSANPRSLVQATRSIAVITILKAAVTCHAEHCESVVFVLFDLQPPQYWSQGDEMLVGPVHSTEELAH